MSAVDKIKNATQSAQGDVKEQTGRATNNPRLEAEGRGDKIAGNVKQAGEKLKDAVT
jgi:uncharacterized protein YjbJ (UPF0337 family)